MYKKRFGLHRKPFQSVLTEHDFFESETFSEILPGVLHALRSDLGVAVLTGPGGVGKSVTLEAVRRVLEPSSQVALLRGGTVRCAADLLYLLHRHLLKCQPEPPQSSDTVRRFEVVERLQRVAGFWGPLVILLDDAHLVEPDVFAELRALLEEEVAGQKLLRLLIAGPLVLEEVLAEPSRSDFSQKIRTHVFLQPLKSSEAVEYLRQGLKNAGGELHEIMEQSAVERIVTAADGIPRCLDLLADETLMVCEKLDRNIVNREIVDRALTDLQHLPYAWNVSLYDDAGDDESGNDGESIGNTIEISTDETSSSASHVQSAHGMIEIGGPASAVSTAAVEPTAATESSNVVEFGDTETMDTSEANETAECSVEIGEDDSDVADSVCDVTQSESIEALECADDFVAQEIDPGEFFSDGDDADDDETGEMTEQSYEADQLDLSNESKLAALFADSSADDNLGAEDEGDLVINSTVSADLEHHLLLAAEDSDENDVLDVSAPMIDCVDVPEVPTGVISDFVDADEDFDESVTDEVVAEEVAADESATELETIEPEEMHTVDLGAYSRWEPAGNWPAERVVGADFQEPPIDSPTVSTEAQTALESQTATPELSEPTAESVFDRYTWRELGRSVSSGVTRRESVSVFEPCAAVWPPVTTGIAPVQSIAIQHVVGDSTHLLDDLNWMDTVSKDATDQMTTQETCHAVSETVDDVSVESTEEDSTFSDPEATIEHLRQLIDRERKISDELADASDNLDVVGTETECELPNDDGSRLAPPHSGGTIELSDWPAGEHRELDSESQQHTNNESCEVETVERLEDGQERDDDAEQIYVPRLLSEARRVVTSSVSRGQLRQAAGAESVVEQTPDDDDIGTANVASPRPRLSLCADDSNDSGDPSADFEIESEAHGRFRNLFTRLRKIGNRSA